MTIYLYRRKIIGLFSIIITGGLVIFTLIYLRIGSAKIQGVYNYINGETNEINFRVQRYDDRLKRRSDVYYFNKNVSDLETQILYLIPKSIEFIFRPNIFDIDGYYDLFKLFETILCLYLLIVLFKRNKKDKFSKMIFYSVICLIMIYGSYSGDLNQGHRHKLKFFPLIVLGLTLTYKNEYAFYLSPSGKSSIKKG